MINRNNTTEPYDAGRVSAACETACAHLLATRSPEGFWEGRLSSSALSTATAVSALALACLPEDVAMIRAGVAWLVETQCADGGWGDTPDSPSNLATTLLAVSALTLAKAPAGQATLAKASAFVAQYAGDSAEARVAAISAAYGADRTFAVPILLNCALAGLVPWAAIPGLPFELAAFPPALYSVLRLNVVSYALPALIAVGLLLHHRHPPRNPLSGIFRTLVTAPVLAKLARIQPAHGGFLDATPLTSFVAMSLLPLYGVEQPVVRRCLHFLRQSFRADGSWPIDSNLSVWMTSSAVTALATSGALTGIDQESTRRWLLARQYPAMHPYTHAAPGGWGWTHLPGGVPDADDTAGAIIALTHLEESAGVTPRVVTAAQAQSPIPPPFRTGGVSWWRGEDGCDGPTVGAVCSGEGDAETRRQMTHEALSAGTRWLLQLQNRDGGWPTFCRGWGHLPFDKSSPDVTAHAIRALHTLDPAGRQPAVQRAIAAGFCFLSGAQRADGAWIPLWFGNQHAPGGLSPVLGTARVLRAYRDVQHSGPEAPCAVQYLLQAQSAAGGWGGAAGVPPSVEETALAVSALRRWRHLPAVTEAWQRGIAYLLSRIEDGTWRQPAPIGLYFASLWYSEQLYPIIWTVEALGGAVEVQ